MTTRYQSQALRGTVVERDRYDGIVRASCTEQRRSNAYLAAPTVQSHAAMLERLPDGDLGLVWFGGTQEGVGDISIWFSRLEDDADVWSTPRRLTDDPTRSEQNPVLFSTPTGDVWLLYTAQLAGNQDTAEVRRLVSTDSGATWTDPETLFPATEAGGVFIRQPLVVTVSGRWLLPIFRCTTTPGVKWSGDHDTSAVMVSDDQGGTWREVAVPDSTGSVHMSIVTLKDGTLHALFRSRWADHIHESRSVDDGDTWPSPAPTLLPNNNSSIQHRALSDGSLVLVYNHASRADATARRESLYDEIDDDGLVEGRDAAPEGGAVPRAFGDESGPRHAFWGAPRAPMTVALSSDEGVTWRILGDLDEGDGYCLTNNSREGLNREFSYPVICERPDGDLDVAYTYFRQTIKHVRISRSWRGPGA